MKQNQNSDTVKKLRERITRHRNLRIGIVKKQVLLLLLGGISLGLSGSPRTSWKILGEMRKEWKNLKKQAAERAINSLYTSKLIAAKENTDGTLTLTLTIDGKKKALTYDFRKMKIEVPSRWDGLWRLISFDIPVAERETRDAIREHLLRLGFYELHQSLFIHPYDCFEEVEYLVELYDARKYVRTFLVTSVDSAPHLKRFFHLT